MLSLSIVPTVAHAILETVRPTFLTCSLFNSLVYSGSLTWTCYDLKTLTCGICEYTLFAPRPTWEKSHGTFFNMLCPASFLLTYSTVGDHEHCFGGSREYTHTHIILIFNWKAYCTSSVIRVRLEATSGSASEHPGIGHCWWREWELSWLPWPHSICLTERDETRKMSTGDTLFSKQQYNRRYCTPDGGPEDKGGPSLHAGPQWRRPQA